MQIPSGVFTKYAQAADLMLSASVFGKECTLVYTEKITSGGQSEDLYQRRTMNPSGGNRGDEITSLVETTEDVIMRFYWDKKSFTKLGDIELPDGSCMTISPLSLRSKVEKAAFMRYQGWTFEKAAEPKIWGLDANYLVVYWSRA